MEPASERTFLPRPEPCWAAFPAWPSFLPSEPCKPPSGLWWPGNRHVWDGLSEPHPFNALFLLLPSGKALRAEIRTGEPRLVVSPLLAFLAPVRAPPCGCARRALRFGWLALGLPRFPRMGAANYRISYRSIYRLGDRFITPRGDRFITDNSIDPQRDWSFVAVASAARLTCPVGFECPPVCRPGSGPDRPL